LPHPAWAVRRRTQLSAGPYDEALYRSQDYNMILRLARTNEGAFIDERVLYQRKHEAMRGPAADRTYTDHTIDKWIKYDAVIFRSLERNWRLRDFRPFADETHEQERALALLQKGIILFQRKVYDGARRALLEYRAALDRRAPSAAERMIAAGLMGCHHGVEDLLDFASEGGELAGWMRARQWPLSLRIAFATQIRWRVRAAVSAGKVAFAGGLLRYSREAFGSAATLAIMGSKYSAGLKAWRS